MAGELSTGLALGIGLRARGRLERSRRVLLEMAKRYPGDPRVNYQCAWAHDVMGREGEAIPFYERAIRRGLAGRDLEGAFLGLGSSYRCVGEAGKAAAVLGRGAARFPSSRSLKVFLAMALHGQGRHDDALGILLRQLAETSSDPGISRYRKAISLYAAEFAARPRRRVRATALRKIDSVSVKVADPAAAADWYVRVMGLIPLWKDSRSIGLRFPENDAEIVLHNNRRIPGRVDVSYLVAHADRAASGLRRQGCKILAGPFDIPIGKCVVIQDPFGVPMTLLDMSKGPRRA